MSETTGTSKDGAEPTGGEHSSSETGGGDTAAHRATGGEAPAAGEVEQLDGTPEGGTRVAPSRARKGMFGVHGTGDTSGFGGLRLPGYAPAPAERPFGGWFDELADELGTCLDRRESVLALCRTFRDEEGLRFELCSSVSGVDYGPEVEQRLHVVYHLTSMTYRRCVRLEVALDVDDPHVPSVVEVYPTADWQERETWDMYGVVFDGHPALTRILMPDDWEGHPQRKDYPLGGIPVEYKGAEIPPPDERRSYS